VEVKDNAVYVNDVKLDEPYIASPLIYTYTVPKTTVPEGKYFVLGDNRNHSNDSHYGWFVDREDIRGKAWLSTWPPSLWGIIPNYPLGKQLVSAGS
jgi:signal peptidase I